MQPAFAQLRAVPEIFLR